MGRHVRSEAGDDGQEKFVNPLAARSHGAKPEELDGAQATAAGAAGPEVAAYDEATVSAFLG